MKNFILSMVLFFLPFSLVATDCIPDCECETDWTLEVRGAYYQLSSRSIKKVCSKSWLDYQVEVAKRVHNFWEIWGGVSWAAKHGHTHKRSGYYSYNFREDTRISILPVSLGLKFIYPILPFIDVYAGAGVCYSFLRIKNHCREHYSYWGLSEPPLRKAVYKNEFGALFKLGFQVAMSDSTFLDFFADYYLQRFHFSHKNGRASRDLFKHTLDCSGFKFGAGFGVYF